MPERVTKEERIVSLAIEKARKAKEELSAKKRKNIEPTQVLEIDTDPEVEKIKRPKVQDASKITNQTQKKEGYGLAGDSLKKSSLNKGQPPNSWEQVVQMAEEAIKNSGDKDAGAMKALRRLAQSAVNRRTEFSIPALEEAMKEASNYDAMLRFIGIRPKF